MKSVFKPVLLAGLLSFAAIAGFAQTPGFGPSGPMMGQGGPMHHQGMGRMDPARMQAMIDRRLAELKQDLKIAPAQEAAWTTFTAAMKPPVELQAKRPDLAEMAKLTTPERIDKMKAVRTQHMGEMIAAMDQRGDATKALYATLTSEQKAVFDAADMRHRRSLGGHMGGHWGGKGPG